MQLFGLRFQLDLDGVDYVPLLGHELDVTATVTDPSGDVGEGLRRVVLSKSLRRGSPNAPDTGATD